MAIHVRKVVKFDMYAYVFKPYYFVPLILHCNMNGALL